MVKRRNEYPEVGEVIIGTVKAVNPNSALVGLDEYKKTGLVHVSEISRKWVRDIRQFARVGEKMVCVVTGVDPERDHVNLSVKRLSDSDKNKRLQEWKRDQKGEKLLEKMAEKEGMSLDEVYEKVGFDLQDSFRDMLEGFETALTDPSLLERKGFEKEAVEMIKSISDENIEIKEREMQGYLDIKCLGPNAIEVIKSTLMSAQKKYKVKIGYLSSPQYSISYSTKDLKQGEKILKEAADAICSEIRKNDGECDFHRNKEM